MSRRGRRQDGGRGEAVWPSAHRQPDRPKEHGQDAGADERAPGKRVPCLLAEADAEIPDEMAETAEQVVEDRPTVAEEDQDAEPRAEEAIGDGEGMLAHSGGNQP